MRTFSRIQLKVDYGTLADLISLPEGMRIVLVRADDVNGEVSLVVEGIGEGFKYKTFAGIDIVCKRVNSRRDIEEGLYLEKEFEE